MTNPNLHRLPSNNWITASELNTREEEEIILFHNKINIRALVDICMTKRENAVGCTISERFTCGTENVLKEIVFEDGVIWVARLPIKKHPPECIRSEVITMEYVQSHTTIPIPRVLGYDDTPDNALLNQYILMEAIYGRTLSKSEDPLLFSIPDGKVDTVFAQLADVVLQLSSLRFPEIGSLNKDVNGEYYIDDVFGGPGIGRFKKCSTPAEYFHSIVASKKGIEEKVHRHHKSQIEREAKHKVELASNFKSSSTSYPLCHTDLRAANILFNDNYKIVAVIDWSYAHSVPIECMCRVPGGGFVASKARLSRVGPKWLESVLSRQSKVKKFKAAYVRALEFSESGRAERKPGCATEEQLSAIFEGFNARVATTVFSAHYVHEWEVLELLEENGDSP